MTDLDWRIIVTMYEQKNITETAAKLFMSQPILTKRLQKIETEQRWFSFCQKYVDDL